MAETKYVDYIIKEKGYMIYILEDDDGIRNLVGYTLNNSGLVAESFGLPRSFGRRWLRRLRSLWFWT
jgi:hypothetical protein